MSLWWHQMMLVMLGGALGAAGRFWLGGSMLRHVGNSMPWGTLTANLVDGNVVLTDANGGTATVVTTDVDASNGVIHVIDTVLMPAS